MPEATYLSNLPSMLPRATISNLWAKISLLGHVTLFGQVTLVNVGSETCEVPLFMVIEPGTPDHPRELTSCQEWGWCVLGARKGARQQVHFVGRSALYEIEPVSEERVRQERESSRYPVAIGRGGRPTLRNEYQEALEAAGLLVPGVWSEAHQAVIDAYDEAHLLKDPAHQADKPKPADDYDFSDPFAEPED